MSKGKLLGGVIGIAAILVGAYYYAGVLTQQHFEERVEYLNEQGEGATAEVLSYKRGVFNSEALVKLTLTDQDAIDVLKELGLDSEYEITQKIYHGPITLGGPSVHLGLGMMTLDIPLSEYKNIATEGGDSISAVSYISFGRDVSVEFNTPTIKGTAFEGMTFHFAAVSGQMSISGDQKQITGDMHLPGFAIQTEGFKFGIDNIKFDVDQTFITDNVAVGGGNLSVEKFALKDDDEGLNFEVNNMSFNNTIDAKEDKLSSLIVMKGEKALVDGVTYRPVVMEMEGRNFAVQKLEDFSSKIRQVQKQHPDNPEAVGNVLFAELPILLSGVALEIKELSLGTEKGALKGHALVEIGDVPADVATNPFAALGSITATAHLEAPVAVTEVMGIKDFAEMNRQQGILMFANDVYSVDFSFDKGMTTLNNAPMGMPGMGGPMPGPGGPSFDAPPPGFAPQGESIPYGDESLGTPGAEGSGINETPIEALPGQ